MSKPAVQRNSSASSALHHLAENGPTAEADLRTLMAAGRDGKTAATNAGSTLRRLEGLGFVKSRVLLTPAGLQELERLGMVPEREGVVR